jgi:ribonuclease D
MMKKMRKNGPQKNVRSQSSLLSVRNDIPARRLAIRQLIVEKTRIFEITINNLTNYTELATLNQCSQHKNKVEGFQLMITERTRQK